MVYTMHIGTGSQLYFRKGKCVMDKLSKRILKGLTGYFVICAIIVILFKTVLVLSFIPSKSMEGTIMDGDIVFATRYDIGEGDIGRYDILIFMPPDEPDTAYIKRVIGLPGETIEVKNGKVYADGTELDGSFVKNPMNRKGDGTYEVPEGCFFFMGDNRNQSKDSRHWEEKYVPLGNIKGKARLVIFLFHNIQYAEKWDNNIFNHGNRKRDKNNEKERMSLIMKSGNRILGKTKGRGDGIYAKTGNDFDMVYLS